MYWKWMLKSLLIVCKWETLSLIMMALLVFWFSLVRNLHCHDIKEGDSNLVGSVIDEPD
jgi:hypothetical protein